jgi:hypothetical protein
MFRGVGHRAADIKPLRVTIRDRRIASSSPELAGSPLAERSATRLRFVAYAALILYQRCHTVADILTSTVPGRRRLITEGKFGRRRPTI